MNGTTRRRTHMPGYMTCAMAPVTTPVRDDVAVVTVGGRQRAQRRRDETDDKGLNAKSTRLVPRPHVISEPLGTEKTPAKKKKSKSRFAKVF